jgi:hypothetical protein
MSLAEILATLEVLVPGGATIAAKLAATTDASRVIAVLSDEPRVRTIGAVCDGVVVDTKSGPFIRANAGMPSAQDLVDAVASNPLGGWAGSEGAVGWLVPSPAALLAGANMSITRGEPFVSVTCTLDQVNEVSGEPAVTAALEADLPELASEEARALALVMSSYVEGYASYDDQSARINGVLVPGDRFESGCADGTFVIGRPRALGLPAIAALHAKPAATMASARDRLLARLGVAAQPVGDDHYVHISEQAREAAIVFGLRKEEREPMTGWTIVSTDAPVDSQSFGYASVKELAAERFVWSIALCLPTGWSFTAINNGTIVYTAPDGSTR